jgi:hypothetical protein
MFEKIQSTFKNFDWSMGSIMKVSGMALVGLVALSVGLTIFGALLSFGQRTVQTIAGNGYSMNGSRFAMSQRIAPSYAMPVSAPMGMEGGMGMMGEKMAYGTDSGMPVMADMMIAPPQMPQVNGSQNAELYQKEGYSASYETRNFTDTCGQIEALKPLEYVLFDSANQAARYCTYAFRVRKAHTEEIVTKLKALNPKEWNVSVQSVAQNIEDSGDRIQILKRRLASTEGTLTEVEQSFGRLSVLATQNGKVADLTTIITQKLAMVERLTNEKLSLEEQIRSMTGGKGDQIKETEYSHFSVSVSKWSAVDWQSLKDNWRNRIQSTLYEMSETLSWILLAIPALVLTLLWYALMAGMFLAGGTLFVKYMWKLILKIWNW